MGGAIYYRNFINSTIINCSFIGNYIEDGNGGAIYFAISNNSNIINCTFINNTIDDGYGRAICAYSGYNTNIINCTFIGNECGYVSEDDEYGGAVDWKLKMVLLLIQYLLIT